MKVTGSFIFSQQHLEMDVFCTGKMYTYEDGKILVLNMWEKNAN